MSFRVPSNPNHSVILYVEIRSSPDLRQCESGELQYLGHEYMPRLVSSLHRNVLTVLLIIRGNNAAVRVAFRCTCESLVDRSGLAAGSWSGTYLSSPPLASNVLVRAGRWSALGLCCSARSTGRSSRERRSPGVPSPPHQSTRLFLTVLLVGGKGGNDLKVVNKPHQEVRKKRFAIISNPMM